MVITYAIHDAASASGLLDTVIVAIYEATHADLLSNPFYSTPRFTERVRGYLKAPGFGLAIATAYEVPAGLAFGYALQPAAAWWDGLITPVPEGFTTETGRRTFALCEIMTDPRWQRQGIARALHDRLLASRREERATLLVRRDNEAAHAAYATWGWRKSGLLQPYPDAPVYDALVLPLARVRSS